MFYYERKLQSRGIELIIGVDEVGRGPLAGPVVAAAVVLKEINFSNRIDDSKKLSSLQRENAFKEIIRKSVFGIGIVNEKIIDRKNILVATTMAMEEAVLNLLYNCGVNQGKGCHILVDGTVKLNLGIEYTNIIKGDSRSISIASASIVAKVVRDRIMVLYDRLYPVYGFLRHKGYPTLEHRDALKKFGASAIHRMSFDGV
ncbi:MAG: ribonuclease HII [Candidatus Omnitrophica bacterium]|nr:ribonuclease HII [Candidatus Omnitrophota bacterium]MDD5652766.1 ribonuclease HII [Candidatus Omnitrophota bacterium]